MRLNITKCEVISNGKPQTVVPLDQFVCKTQDDATQLGAPLLTGAALDKALEKKCVKLKHASERLQLITSHDALFLLKSSCAHPG